MKWNRLHIIYITLLCLLSLSFTKNDTTPIYIEIPKGWPQPQYNTQKNPLTNEGFQLGKELFYDPILSRNNTISCASCHLQATSFTHVDHDLSHGIDDRIGTRNSLALINLAWSKNFMWDGGINHIEVQPLAPITSAVEMDETLENVVRKLQQSEKYSQLFQKAFGTQKITGQLTLKALSQFLVMLTSTNSKYDKVMCKETTFSTKEQNGYILFKNHCASCHQEPLFTSDRFENNGLPIDSTLNDLGRMKITQDPNDAFKFKVPTLRNIQFTYPYMHDGRFTTLTEVVKHYNSGIHQSKTLSKQLQNPMNLSDNDRVDLVAFLLTLSDNDFLFNPKFGYSKK